MEKDPIEAALYYCSREDSPPIRLSAKTRLHRFHYRFTSLGKLDAGFVIYEDKNYILVNKKLQREYQRIAAAREFGHFVLGHGPLATNGVKHQGRQIWEVQDALIFAREILMPRFLLVLENKLAAADIAMRYQVPIEEVREHLKKLPNTLERLT